MIDFEHARPACKVAFIEYVETYAPHLVLSDRELIDEDNSCSLNSPRVGRTLLASIAKKC